MGNKVSACGACGAKYETPVFAGDAERLRHMSPMTLCVDGAVRCSRCYPDTYKNDPCDGRNQRAVA